MGLSLGTMTGVLGGLTFLIVLLYCLIFSLGVYGRTP